MGDYQIRLYKYRRLFLFTMFIICYNIQGQEASVDRVYEATCGGFNIYSPSTKTESAIFKICPYGATLKDFINRGDLTSESSGQNFRFTRLSRKPTEVPPVNLAVGVRDFAREIYRSSPIPASLAPWAVVSSNFYSTSITGDDVRNVLMYGDSHRMNAYLERSMNEESKQTLYVVGKTKYMELFNITWLYNPKKEYLNYRFKQRLKQLDSSSAASLDAFIRSYGTHYRRNVVFGGTFGTDFYFQGYGTTRDQRNAIQHVQNSNLFATQNGSYVPSFLGFGDSGAVASYSWCFPKGQCANGDEAFEMAVIDNPVLIKQELRSITELFETMRSEIPNIYVIMDRFEDRVSENALRRIKESHACFDNKCSQETICMGNSCSLRPRPPRWPDQARFCIPKPIGQRCPSPDIYNEFHDDTYVFWDTENGDVENYRGADQIISHGLEPKKLHAVLTDDQYNGGIKMFYCCSKQPESRSWQRTKWPAGTYCLYSYVTWSILLPREWSFDSILWNDEDTDNSNDFKTSPDFGAIPFGHYHPSYTEQKLMCRDDGHHLNPIILPREHPFYLVRNGGRCQEVWGMVWTHVEVAWDTENDIVVKNEKYPNEHVRYNQWKRVTRFCGKNCMEKCEKEKDRKKCVRLTQDKIVMDFCYYEEKSTPAPTPAPTPSPTPPTEAPTTDSPTLPPPTERPPPTPPPPTRRPTPAPTRPTPSPTFPSMPPTPSPTLAAPTPFPTKSPTPAPTPPSPAPTPAPSPSPTPAPTACPYCPNLNGVNIVGLNSEWPMDVQPENAIFDYVPCQCLYCEGTECDVKEDCRIKYHLGDMMLLTKFWKDHPIEFEEDDLVFLRVTWAPGTVTNGPNNEFFRNIDRDELRRGTLIDLSHARNALLFGGSKRMQDYGNAHSILSRHIAANYNDKVFLATHWVTRTRRKIVALVNRTRDPIYADLSDDFVFDGDDLQRSYWESTRGQLTEEKLNKEFDNFIQKFGTHYIDSAVFGGMYGADWYFSGYGTKPEMTIAMRDIKNLELESVFERHRFTRIDGENEFGGASFVRNLGGSQQNQYDVKGWNKGGDGHGIRGSRGDREWKKHLDMDENAVIIHHKKLISIGKLVKLFPKPAYVTDLQTHQTEVENKFKDRVVELAHWWLVLHYYCFFLDNACENQRRHPFLREAELGKCDTPGVSREWKRQRTEMEICIGQRDGESGYMLKSRHLPNLPTKWCKGRVVNELPSNYEPYSLQRKKNCPLSPPAPRWPNAHSYCLPKPVNSESTNVLECPKEHYPEYEWQWDWQAYISGHHDRHDVFSAVVENQIFAGWENINPTNEVWSIYPWKYESNDYEPRTTEYFPPGVNPSPKDALYQSVTDLKDMLSNYDPSVLPVKTDCYMGECRYALDYQEYKLYPVNRVYIRTQAPFLQEIGWMFWDTEDSTDGRPMSDIQTADDPTPTHMAVADSWPIKDVGNWDVICDSNGECSTPGEFDRNDVERGGKKNSHELLLKKYTLWKPPPLTSFNTGGTRMQFCCTTISEDQAEKATHKLHWPDGHLCIYGHGAIDSTIYEFRQGSIGWDCENGEIQNPKIYGNKIYSDSANDVMQTWDEVARQQRLTHSLPTGLYHIQYDGRSEQYFGQNVLCMKRETDQFLSVELPRDIPFYLMRYKGSCQAVRGMMFTQVSLTWWTEINHKTRWVDTGTYDKKFIPLEMNSWGRAQAYGRRDQIPDGEYSQAKIQIFYCFYQPNIIYQIPEKTVGDEPGILNWFDLDVAVLDPKWNNPPSLLKNSTHKMQLLAMNQQGVYNVKWPVTEICYRG